MSANSLPMSAPNIELITRVLILASLTMLKNITLFPCVGSFSWTLGKTPLVLPLWLVRDRGNKARQSGGHWE